MTNKGANCLGMTIKVPILLGMTMKTQIPFGNDKQSVTTFAFVVRNDRRGRGSDGSWNGSNSRGVGGTER